MTTKNYLIEGEDFTTATIVKASSKKKAIELFCNDSSFMGPSSKEGQMTYKSSVVLTEEEVKEMVGTKRSGIIVSVLN